MQVTLKLMQPWNVYFAKLRLVVLLCNSSGPTRVDVAVIFGSAFAAMVAVILCIGIAIIAVVYLTRKQHAKKVDLKRYVILVS